MNGFSGRLTEMEREVLGTLQKLLYMIGSANDAEDHGYRDDAIAMRMKSCEAIQDLVDRHPFLLQLIPEIRSEIETGHILGFGWSNILNVIDECLSARHLQCRTCSTLAENEYARQKFGWEENDTHLPEAAGRLEVVHDFHPYDSRKLQLKRCPECGTYYLYRTDYEYLVNGSEDEEFLSRLTQVQADEYLRKGSRTNENEM